MSTTYTEADTTNSRLSSSISSLSSSQGNLSITQIYKNAQSLFLTRRVQEALDAIQPLLQPTATGDASETAAPIATASRGARIKVWSLYCSILNEVVEMGADEGKKTFGPSRWKELSEKARSGSVWEQVVQDGYHGSEGDVDADVVATLATLLLAHAPSQKLTQQRLEDYLSATGTSIISPTSVNDALNRPKAARSNTNGTSTPRDLVSRLKILEIYTLHVLPRNKEWQYAREFVNMSEILDDDRREAFLQALQSLQDENSIEARREAELARQREMQMEDQKRAQQEKAELEARKREQQQKAEAEVKKRRAEQSAKNKAAERDLGVDKASKTTRAEAPTARAGANGRVAASKRNGGAAAASRPASYYGKASSLFGGVQRILAMMGSTLRANPTLMLRFLAFVIAFLMALSRRDVRDRVRGARDSAWAKLKSTVGMGVKVSYI